MEEKSISQGELAKRAGISRQRINEYYFGKKTPGADAAFALADAIGIQARWLIREEGAKFVGAESPSGDDWVMLPRYDLYSFESAKPPAILSRVPMARDWLMLHARTISNVWVTEMPNDAMPATAARGDLIVCKPPGDRLQDRKIYALLLDGRPLVRSVELRSGGMALTAQNPAIEAIVPTDEQLEQLLPLGQVVGAVVGV